MKRLPRFALRAQVAKNAVIPKVVFQALARRAGLINGIMAALLSAAEVVGLGTDISVQRAGLGIPQRLSRFSRSSNPVHHAFSDATCRDRGEAEREEKQDHGLHS